MPATLTIKLNADGAPVIAGTSISPWSPVYRYWSGEDEATIASKLELSVEQVQVCRALADEPNTWG